MYRYLVWADVPNGNTTQTILLGTALADDEEHAKLICQQRWNVSWFWWVKSYMEPTYGVEWLDG
jgi:hypothetical protein